MARNGYCTFKATPCRNADADEHALLRGHYLGYVLAIGHGADTPPHPPTDTGRNYSDLGFQARYRVPINILRRRLRSKVAGPKAYRARHAELLTFSCITAKVRDKGCERRSPHSSAARETMAAGWWEAV